MVDWSRALILIDNDNGFTDGNNRSVRPLDVVEYRFGARRGILLEALSDGDAFVIFRDTKKIENVKWHHLCKVPAIDETAASGQ
jgi:hypothetical protein